MTRSPRSPRKGGGPTEPPLPRREELLEYLRRSENPLAPQEEQVARHSVDVLLGKFDEPGTRRERHTRETLRETLVQLSKQRY